MTEFNSSFITNVSEFKEANSDFPMPIFCFPEIIDKKPINFIYCLIYIVGCALFAVLGFYYYFKGKRNRNELDGHQQTPLRKFGYEEELSRVFPSRPNPRDQRDAELASG